MQSFLERVAAVFRKREVAKAETFDSLVAAIVDGREPSPEDVAQHLEAAGKTPAELAEAVAYRTERVELARHRDQLPELAAEFDEQHRLAALEMEKWCNLRGSTTRLCNPSLPAASALRSEIAAARRQRQP